MRKLLSTVAALILSSQPAALAAGFYSRSIDFGGDGHNGTVTVSSNTAETAAVQKNYLSLAVNNGITYTVQHLSVLNAVATVTVNGTIAVGTGFPGGVASTGRIATSGSGPGGGFAPGAIKKDNDGGGGGGNVGHGGTGGSAAANYSSNNGGRGTGTPCFGYGGGGAAGQADSNLNVGNAGGAGGGSVRIIANKAISIPSGGVIRANGTSGTTGSANTTGAGGGAGGFIGLYSRTSIVNNGTIQCTGGNGGNGVGSGNTGGGGGGGGGVVFFAPSVTEGTVTLTGGSAGTGGTQMAAGSSGAYIKITDTPTLPLICEVENSLPEMFAMARENGGSLTITEIVPFLASLPEHDNFHTSKEATPVAILPRRKHVSSSVA